MPRMLELAGCLPVSARQASLPASSPLRRCGRGRLRGQRPGWGRLAFLPLGRRLGVQAAPSRDLRTAGAVAWSRWRVRTGTCKKRDSQVRSSSPFIPLPLPLPQPRPTTCELLATSHYQLPTTTNTTFSKSTLLLSLSLLLPLPRCLCIHACTYIATQEY